MNLEISRLIKRLTKYHVKIENGCWVWTGTKYPTGYGQLWFRDKLYCAHRLMAFLSLGLNLDDISSKNYVLHKCDNRACINPAHLEIGTQSKNLHDRSRNSKFRCKHPNTPENTLIDSLGRKVCRICRKENCKRYYNNKLSRKAERDNVKNCQPQPNSTEQGKC